MGYDYRSSTDYLFKISGNDALRQKSSASLDRNPDYVEDFSKGIPVAKYKNGKGVLRLDVNATSVIGVFGPSGSGKTTGDMAIASRCFLRGRVAVNVADTDLHFRNLDNHGGVSQDLIDKMGLFKNEEPIEIPQKTVNVKYLLNEMPGSDKPSNIDPFTLSFQDVSSSELKFLLGNGLDRNQIQALENILNDVDINKDLTFDGLRQAVNDNQDIHGQIKNKLIRNINNLESSEIISTRYSLDIESVVESGKAFSIGMKGFSSLDEDDYYRVEFVAKKAVKRLIDAKINGNLDKPFIGVVPEAHHLMPKDSQSILADLLKRNFTFYQRRSNFPMILDTQLPSQVSGKVLEEVNHAFIGCDENGKSLPKSEWSDVLRLMNTVANPNKEYSSWMKKIQRLGHRDFLYVNASMTDPSDAPIVRFLAPLVSNP